MKGVKEQGIAGDMIPAFFESISGAHPEVPETISGSLKFDVKEGNASESWRVTFSQGVVSSARSNETADCVVRTDKATLEAIIEGKVNTLVALLRGELSVDGEALLLTLCRSLFTGAAAVMRPSH